MASKFFSSEQLYQQKWVIAMSLFMKITLTTSIIVIFIVIFLWILTGSWIEDGFEPRGR